MAAGAVGHECLGRMLFAQDPSQRSQQAEPNDFTQTQQVKTKVPTEFLTVIDSSNTTDSYNQKQCVCSDRGEQYSL